MELVGGPVGESEFASEQDRQATWHRHREQLMERRGSQAGDRPWGFWVYEVGRLVDASRLEQVLQLHDRGELSEEERHELSAAAEHARNGVRCQSVTTPASAARDMERSEELHRREAIEIDEGRSRRSRRRTVPGRSSVYERREFGWRGRLRRPVDREKPPAPLCDPPQLVVERGRHVGHRCEDGSVLRIPEPAWIRGSGRRAGGATDAAIRMTGSEGRGDRAASLPLLPSVRLPSFRPPLDVGSHPDGRRSKASDWLGQVRVLVSRIACRRVTSQHFRDLPRLTRLSFRFSAIASKMVSYRKCPRDVGAPGAGTGPSATRPGTGRRLRRVGTRMKE